MKLFSLILLFFALGHATKAETSHYRLNECQVEQSIASSTDETHIIAELYNSFTDINNTNSTLAEKNKVVAGVLGICCGAFGIHRFYLGHSNAGIIYLAATILSSVVGYALAYYTGCSFGLTYLGTAVWIVGIIDGILYLVADDKEFDSKYVSNPKIIQWL